MKKKLCALLSGLLVTALLIPAAAERSAGFEPSDSRILVACFSATEQTWPLAQYAAEYLHADLFRIEAETPYTAQDLNYNDNSSRANREMNDDTARPALAAKVDNMAQYDTVIIAHPIWWGQAPRIIETFIEAHDLRGKTMVSFCTSASSGYGRTGKILKALTGEDVNWLEGRRFSARASRQEIEKWLDQIGIEPYNGGEEDMIYLTANGVTWAVKLSDNSSAEALKELLKGGPREIAAHDYGNFEKVGALGTSLPRNDAQITTAPGDLILYQGNQVTLYYDRNSWSFTRLGKIENVTREALLDVLGSGDVTMTLSLDHP